MSEHPDAPFAARLVAFALTIGALFGLVAAWLHRRTFAAMSDPELGWDGRDGLMNTLAAFEGGGLLLELLLAGLLLAGLLRYGRAVGERIVGLLSLGAGLLLGLDVLRGLGFKLLSWYGGPAALGLSWEQVMPWWGISGLVVGGGGLVLLLIAAARSERLLLGTRPRWPFVSAGALALYVLVTFLVAGTRRENFDLSLVDLLPLLYNFAVLTLAGGLVLHARRITADASQAAWTRAAAGLDRYRDATALRVLTMVCVVVFLVIANMSRFTPIVTIGGLCLLLLTGLVIAVVQIAGLVRVTDAPGSRVALGVALPLIGLATAGECVSLAPLLGLLFDGVKDVRHLRDLTTPEVGLAAQAIALVAVITLLLALRGLARDRGATAQVARCHRLIAVIVSFIAVIVGLALSAASLTNDRQRGPIVILVIGVGCLIAAIWLLVVYFRLLADLRDAMRRPVVHP